MARRPKRPRMPTPPQPALAKPRGRKRKRGRRAVGKELAPKPRVKLQKVQVIARKGQPRPIAEVPVLIKQTFGGQVASSWIGSIVWDNDTKEALMLLLNGYFYGIKMPFSVYQKWYYALSKGTFFNEVIKGRYTVKRLF